MIDPPRVFAALPWGLREELLNSYQKIMSNYLERRWDPSELNGGQFCEVVYSIINGAPLRSDLGWPKAQPIATKVHGSRIRRLTRAGVALRASPCLSEHLAFMCEQRETDNVARKGDEPSTKPNR
jgi:hypothetical protein